MVGMKSSALILLALVLVPALVLPGAAGSAAAMAGQPPAYLVPIDQAVTDQDPLARSLRVVQVGLRHDGEQTSLFGSPDRGSGRFEDEMFYRVGPGFRARLSRMDYIVPVARDRDRIIAEMNINPVVDGHFLEQPHSHLVWELEPRPLESGPLPLHPPDVAEPDPVDAEQPPAEMFQRRLDDARIDGRIDGRIDARIGGGR